MRLYSSQFAPNPLRVLIVAQEKGLEIEVINLAAQHPADFRAINALDQVPALELDDGRIITESLTICQYLDAISGTPFLFGEKLDNRTRIGMWERRAEMLLFNPSIEFLHHTHPMFHGSTERFPVWAKSLVPKALQLVEIMGHQLEISPYLAGDQFTAADITAYLVYFGFAAAGVIPTTINPTLHDWADRVAGRDSMAILKQVAAFLRTPVTQSSSEHNTVQQSR